MLRPLLILSGLLMILSSSLSFANANLSQDLEMLREMAADFVNKQIHANEGDQTEVRIGHLDTRLKLNACRKGLTLFAPPGARYLGRSTVGIRCSGPTRWKVYISSDIKLLRPVLVARHYLAKGHKIQASDIELQARDIATLNNGYLTNNEAVIGQRLRRSQQAGQALRPQQLKKSLLIRRGEQVQLVIQAGGLTVTAKAKALANGTLGQSIAVKNLRSNKQIDAVVKAPGRVALSL